MNNEDQKNWNEPSPETMNKWKAQHSRGRIIGGLIVVAAGALFLAREMGAAIPEWIFTWQMLLIAIGIFIGLKHAFRHFSWFILVLIGTVFLMRDYHPEWNVTHYLWPIVIIIVGLSFIFKPHRKYCGPGQRKRHFRRFGQTAPEENETIDADDYFEINSVFGSVKKNIVSKNFRGGEVNAIFGGAELNLSQADIVQSADLEINTVFGGMRLIVPQHWEIKSELNAVMGSVEDKRPIQVKTTTDTSKILILRGSAVFGGIEINCY